MTPFHRNGLAARAIQDRAAARLTPARTIGPGLTYWSENMTGLFKAEET